MAMILTFFVLYFPDLFLLIILVIIYAGKIIISIAIMIIFLVHKERK